MTPKIEFDYSELKPNIRRACFEFGATFTWPGRDPKKAVILVPHLEWFDALTADEVGKETFEKKRPEIEAEVEKLLEKPEPPLQTPRGDYPGYYEFVVHPAPVPVTA